MSVVIFMQQSQYNAELIPEKKKRYHHEMNLLHLWQVRAYIIYFPEPEHCGSGNGRSVASLLQLHIGFTWL